MVDKLFRDYGEKVTLVDNDIFLRSGLTGSISSFVRASTIKSYTLSGLQASDITDFDTATLSVVGKTNAPIGFLLSGGTTVPTSRTLTLNANLDAQAVADFIASRNQPDGILGIDSDSSVNLLDNRLYVDSTKLNYISGSVDIFSINVTAQSGGLGTLSVASSGAALLWDNNQVTIINALTQPFFSSAPDTTAISGWANGHGRFWLDETTGRIAAKIKKSDGTTLTVAGLASVNGSGVLDVTTTGITEGTNLYYTQTRFDTAFSAKIGAAVAFGNNITVAGTLGVTGASTLASLGVTNNATVGGTLGVTGAVTLSSTLVAAGQISSSTGFRSNDKPYYLRTGTDTAHYVTHGAQGTGDGQWGLDGVVCAGYRNCVLGITNDGTTNSKYKVVAGTKFGIQVFTSSGQINPLLDVSATAIIEAVPTSAPTLSINNTSALWSNSNIPTMRFKGTGAAVDYPLNSSVSDPHITDGTSAFGQTLPSSGIIITGANAFIIGTTAGSQYYLKGTAGGNIVGGGSIAATTSLIGTHILLDNSGSSAYVSLSASAAGTDLKRTTLDALNNGTFTVKMWDDTFTVSNSALSIERSAGTLGTAPVVGIATFRVSQFILLNATRAERPTSAVWDNPVCDRRLKEAIKSIDTQQAVDFISSLDMSSFYWKSDETKTPQIHLIAQDYQKSIEKSGYSELMHDAVFENKDGYLGISIDAAYKLLIPAVKNLNARLTALETKH